jgi:N-acetylglucosaminyldiphosphoundecaprenol N-acetyl-beta-D-mannosaminyltransferase
MKPNIQINILGVSIDNVSPKEVIQRVQKTISNNQQVHLEGVNASKIVDMQHDKMLYDSVVNSSLITPDGQSIVWASKILGKPLKVRVAGIDLMHNLVALAHEKKHTIYLLGAKRQVVEKVAATFKKKYSPTIIAGYRNGYFTPKQEAQIAKDISDSDAQMLFVGISSPQKEHFLHKHKETLKNINLIMGVGGSFDVMAGVTKRAPLWMQRIGMEWFFRFLQEPKRMWKRYLVGNISFIYLVFKERFKK